MIQPFPVLASSEVIVDLVPRLSLGIDDTATEQTEAHDEFVSVKVVTNWWECLMVPSGNQALPGVTEHGWERLMVPSGNKAPPRRIEHKQHRSR